MPKQLTQVDKEIFAILPENWFSVEDLPARIKSPDHRCRRLLDAGMLDWRVVGDIPNMHSEYKKRSVKRN